MPQIAELREIDGAIWARIPPFSPDQGCVQMLSEAEISERDRKTSTLLAEIERLRALLKEHGIEDVPPLRTDKTS